MCLTENEITIYIKFNLPQGSPKTQIYENRLPSSSITEYVLSIGELFIDPKLKT